MNEMDQFQREEMEDCQREVLSEDAERQWSGDEGLDEQRSYDEQRGQRKIDGVGEVDR